MTSLRLSLVLRGLEVILQILRLAGHFCGDHGASAPPPSYRCIMYKSNYIFHKKTNCDQLNELIFKSCAYQDGERHRDVVAGFDCHSAYQEALEVVLQGFMTAQHPPSPPFQAKYSEVGEPLEDIISISIFAKSALNCQNAFDFSPRTMTGIKYVTILLFKLNIYIYLHAILYDFSTFYCSNSQLVYFG